MLDIWVKIVFTIFIESFLLFREFLSSETKVLWQYQGLLFLGTYFIKLSEPLRIQSRFFTLKSLRTRPLPLFKVGRLLGLKLKPPLYSSFLFNFILSAIWFGVIWGLIMWFWTWEKQGMTLSTVLITSALAGCSFGLLMSIYYKYSAKKYKLSNWDDLLNQVEN